MLMQVVLKVEWCGGAGPTVLMTTAAARASNPADQEHPCQHCHCDWLLSFGLIMPLPLLGAPFAKQARNAWSSLWNNHWRSRGQALPGTTIVKPDLLTRCPLKGIA